ncbi:copper amine oxidase N-terminal domain-containing protein [Cohnella sp. AR92]|uniref:copper amine oxidase N-terminal domain-containing protein n=1 Tax=Cohnella sp. AR92 TaxID=648716 RepID=UPI000F8C62F2|nr:copper amine oxidase N-terminal domain-containing protein [Cohnella sp. AR92]RUS46743.1 copper amine oxidase N-terminal domain-containing protein [Cohnella sp. AR92]
MIRTNGMLVLLLGTALWSAPLLSASAYADEADPAVEGKLKENRMLIPLRSVSEKMGAEVAWDSKSKDITIIKGDVVIVLKVDSKIVYVNQKEVQIDVPAYLENSRTFVPLRFVSQVMGAEVEWSQAAQSATVSLDGKQIRIIPEKPAPQILKKITEQQLTDMISKVNEATNLASIKNVKTTFSSYFTDKMIQSLSSSKGLAYNVRIVNSIRLGNVAYKDEKTAIYLESSEGDLHPEYTEPGKVLHRQVTFLFDGRDWKVDNVSFYVTERQQG